MERNPEKSASLRRSDLVYKATYYSPEPGIESLGKFKVIYADPPWSTSQKGKLGAINHYNLMSLAEIKAMPIADLAADNSACFLWVPNGLIGEGLEVLKAWGFTFRSTFFWLKPGMQLGQYFRNASETLLLGTKGKAPVGFHAQPNWMFASREEHSKKPDEMRFIIQRLYPHCEYLELFARDRVPLDHWYYWGNECEGGSDVFLPGYPVPEYSDKVKFASPELKKKAEREGRTDG